MAYILALSLGPLHSDSLRISLVRLNGAERTSRRGKQEQEVAEVHRKTDKDLRFFCQESPFSVPPCWAG
jgi:hypothetical protein